MITKKPGQGNGWAHSSGGILYGLAFTPTIPWVQVERRVNAVSANILSNRSSRRDW